MAYQHILIATDMSEDCHCVLRKAIEMQSSFNSKTSLIHVIEPLSMAFGGDVPMDLGLLQQQQNEQAQARLEELLSQYPQLQAEHCFVRLGQARQEIHQLAEEENCDLIVVGSHGRHGLALLFGSTTSDLLSRAPCDILAVSIKQES